MERPTDAYKETHNLVLANEDTYFGGQVSNLQVFTYSANEDNHTAHITHKCSSVGHS